MSVVMDGIASINKKVDATNEGMTNLRVELARRGIPVRKETP